MSLSVGSLGYGYGFRYASSLQRRNICMIIREAWLGAPQNLPFKVMNYSTILSFTYLLHYIIVK